MIQIIKARGNLEAHKKLEGYAFLHFKGYSKNTIDTSIKPDFIFIHSSYGTLIFVEVLIEPTANVIKNKITKYNEHCDQLWFYIYREDGRKFDKLIDINSKVRIFYYPEILSEING